MKGKHYLATATLPGYFSDLSISLTHVVCNLGDIGGYMALLLGGSLISIIELVDWILCSIKTKRENSKTTAA